jgi:DNA-binding GntR family transcriptional regulator
MRMPLTSPDGQPVSRLARTAPRLRRETSADHVASHVRHLILTGQLRKGDRVLQDEIADELGVSRIPVREAIIALDREGWVSFAANRGAFVTGLEPDDISDHYELRGLVFGLAAKRVAETATDDEIAELATRFQAMRRAPDLATFSSLNERFISKLLRLANSPRVRAAVLITPSIIPDDFFDVVPAGRPIQEKGTAQLLRLLRARRADDADLSIRATLRKQGELVAAAFAETGLLSSPAP